MAREVFDHESQLTHNISEARPAGQRTPVFILRLSGEYRKMLAGCPTVL